MNAAQTTQPYAVIGNPIAHSLSPWIHARFGEQTGIALHYTRLLSTEADFAASVMQFFQQGGKGLNVTTPFKSQAYALAQAHLSPRARAAQAVNTLWLQDGELHGCNTDGVGLVHDLTHQGIALQDRRILLVGAGGAARGVLLPLLGSACSHLRIVNRTADTALALAESARALHTTATPNFSAGGLADAAGSVWDIVINASSSSLSGQAPDLPKGIYADGAVVYDMMYGANPSPFLRQAQHQGVTRRIDGLGMLVHQAAESFRLWHSVMPDAPPVLTALRQHIAQDG